MRRLIIATGNVHKTEEFAQLLLGSDFDVQSASACGGMPDVDETGQTFAENAQLKAEALHKLAPKGSWVLADDSGLEVDALGGAPGIYSARYAGVSVADGENVEKLLAALVEVPDEARVARFRCVLCLVSPDGGVEYYSGSCEGRITRAPSGTSGFGYDPVFVPEGYQKSFAELGDAIKAELSHRAKAVQALWISLA
ncbi:MAG: RdgB/HAM1 family non-canonical purine NTP pyrophosphatase [Opitutales bacterium]